MTISISAADLALLNAGKPVTLQGPAVVVTPPVVVPPPAGTSGVKIVGNALTDLSGKVLRLKGVDVSGMEFAYIQGWAATNGKANWPTDPFCGQAGGALNFTTLKSWGINAIRLPLNEASINGVTTYDGTGAARNPDPAGNYMAMVKSFLDAALAAQMVVIVDPLHLSAPLLTVPGQTGKVPFSPMGQGPAPNPDTSVSALTKICALLKSYPNSILDPYNEWMANTYGQGPGVIDQWAFWRDGGAMVKFDNNTQGGANYDVVQSWTAAGMQLLVTTARNAGFTGPIILGGISWAGDETGWLAHLPVDPLKQLALSAHIYPTYGAAFGTAAYNAMPAARFATIKAIQAAGYPIVLGEIGGHNVAGTPNEPFTTTLIAAAVTAGWSYFGWAWDVWQNADNVLIKDGAGTPTDGYGVAFKAGA
jgi:endoglucanase